MVMKSDILVNKAFKESVIQSECPNLCFLILGLIRFNKRLAHDYIQGIYYDLYRDTEYGSQYYIRETLKYLIENQGLIKKVGYHNSKKKMGTKYECTEKFYRIESQDTRFYHSFRDMENYNKVVNIDQSNYFKWYETDPIDEANYYKCWLGKLSKKHANKFLPALANLEEREYIYDYDRQLILNTRKRANTKSLTGDLKLRKRFKIRYEPQKTGRLSTNPHIYINKPFRKLIVPATDPGLKKGALFNLDYSANELRIFASLVQNKDLTNLLNTSKNVWQDIIKILNPPEEYANKKFIKSILLSTLYGSDGDGSVNEIHNTWAKKNKYIKNKVIHEKVNLIIDKIKEVIPEIETYCQSLIQKYQYEGELYFKDGIKFKRSYHKKSGRKKSLKVTIVNNYVQALGASIIRRVIINSSLLKYCRLHFTVHDAAAFYVEDKHNLEIAKQEAEAIMVQSAHEVIGSKIKMPVNLEWERS